MKWKIDDVPVFVAVVERNGITAAAEALGRPKSTVSAAITRLEKGLGLRLLDRNSRNLRVTAEGETFYRKAQLILEQVRDADATAAGLSAAPSGRLSVALPPAFAQEIVAPNLALFHRAFPRIELELVVTSYGLDLLRDQVDLAVVVGPQQDSDQVSRVIAAGPLIWVASPDYIAAHPPGDSLDEIRRHVMICETRYGQARMPVHVGQQATHLDLARGVAHVNDPLVVRNAVVNGAGLSVLPMRYCRQQIAEGSLVRVCPHVSFDIAAAALSVVYPSRRLLSPRIRAFVDFLATRCGDPNP
ncbi:MAG: LysR family transcriptional regulator [Qingshengfaniella sp.]